MHLFFLFYILLATIYADFDCSLFQNKNGEADLKQKIEQIAKSPRYLTSDKERSLKHMRRQLKNAKLYDIQRQVYTFLDSNNNNEETKGVNLVSYLFPNTEDYDHIYILMAHYDTVEKSVGVFDNAAGVAVLLQTAQYLSKMNLETKRTQIIFVLTDHEESFTEYKMGSNEFLSEFGNKEKIKGVINLDSVGSWSLESQSQKLPWGFSLLFPIAGFKIHRNHARSNFINLLSIGKSRSLSHSLLKSLNQCNIGKQFPLFGSNNYDQFHVLNLHTMMNNICFDNPYFSQLFCRSDHVWFWKAGIQAVHITDGANFRTKCYHQTCDDLSQLNETVLKNLNKLSQWMIISLYSFLQ